MKVKKADLVALFVALKYDAAKSWSDERLLTKTEKIGGIVDEDTKVGDKKLAQLLKDVLAAQKKGEAIELAGAAKAKDDDEDKPAPKKATKKEEPEDDEDKPAAKDEDDDDDDAPAKDEEDEDEDGEGEADTSGKGEEEDEDKPAKKSSTKQKGAPQKAGGEGSPGVIGSIVEFLSNASKDKPLTKKALGKKLKARFEDRDEESMMKTVNVQVPNRIKKDKGLEVLSKDTDDGKAYWIDIMPAGKKK
jgi:hypothetical protein